MLRYIEFDESLSVSHGLKKRRRCSKVFSRGSSREFVSGRRECGGILSRFSTMTCWSRGSLWCKHYARHSVSEDRPRTSSAGNRSRFRADLRPAALSRSISSSSASRTRQISTPAISCYARRFSVARSCSRRLRAIMLQKFCRLDEESHGEVLRQVEFLPLTLKDKIL